tara:strand:- start:25 stop:405 length:381 start_codon:yes stop_codon:yes gene_type:complete
MLEQIREQRQLTVDRDGAPNFRHTFGEIATTANETVMMRTVFPASRRYEPLMELVITNHSTEAVDLFINGVNFALVPPGVITKITDQPIWYFRLINNDSGTVAAGTIRANITTPPLGADRAARRGL